MTDPEKKPLSKYGRNPEANKVFWDEVRLEYTSTLITLRALADKHGVTKHTLFRWARKEKWGDRRRQFRQRVVKRAETKLVNKGVKEWGRKFKTFEDLDKQIRRIMSKYDDDPEKLMDPQDIKTLASALTETLKGQKLIKGESTGEETNVSFSMRVVQFIKEREKEVEQQNVIDGTPG